MKQIIIIFSLCIFGLQIFGQGGYNRKKRDLIEMHYWKPAGWHFAPGLTYMAPFKPKGENAPDVDPNGRLALYLEVGRWKLFPGGGNVFNYFDYSLAYKRLSGSEKFLDNKSIFKQNFLLGNFNINNVIQLSDYTFIQNSLGVNLDFKFSERMDAHALPEIQNTQRLLFSLHYKFGFGYKATQRLFIIPTLETPILNVKQWERARSDYGIYSSRYRPVIFTVRFAWLLKPAKGDCPPDPRGKNKDGKNFDEMLKME